MKKTNKNNIAKILATALFATMLLLCFALSACGLVSTVFFNPNYDGANVTTQKVPLGQKVTFPTDIQREGYTFGGWFTDKTCTTPAKNDALFFVKELTYFAKWLPNPVSVSATCSKALFVGDEVSKADFAVTVGYFDGTSKSVNDFSVSDLQNLTQNAGETTVEFSYTENGVTVTGNLQITVNPVVLESISAAYNGHEVAVNGEIDKQAVVVTAKYNNGDEKVIEDYLLSYDFSTVGEKTVAVSYTENAVQKTCEFSVTVKDASEVPVALQVSHDGTQFVVGESFRPTTLAVQVLFADGHAQTLNSKQYSYSGFSSKQVGKVVVSVTYLWFSEQVEVQIVNPPLISIVAQYVGRGVEVGDALDYNDIQVTATYQNNSAAVVENFSVGNFSSAKAGTQNVEISYTENGITVSCTLEITVVEKGTLTNGNVSVHFLELGNKYTGDCVYIKAGNTDILIDAGSKNTSAPTITKYLDKFVTDNKLEYVIATHAHEDHIGGFYSESGREGVFEHFKTETIIEFALTNKTSTSTSTVYGKYLAARNGEVKDGANCYTAAQCFNEIDGAQRVYQITDNISLEILYNYYYFNTQSAGENDYSVCVMLRQGENNYLFTGDLEADGERKMVSYYNNKNTPLPQCVLYKAGHHGSKTSSTAELMAAIKPQYVCVCCCCGTAEYTDVSANQFPTQQFINNVAPYTDKVYVTSIVDKYVAKDEWSKNGTVKSMNGNVVFSCNNGVISVNCSNNNLILKETDWFKQNRTCPKEWR